jgi:N-acyl-D-aspartate/D-glutamate deacylase
VLVAFAAALTAQNAPAQNYDVIIRNGRIVDGGGNPWYRADVGIRGGKIVSIGDLSHASASKTIDAVGHIVAPGFIDMMGGASDPMLFDPVAAQSELQQGCTTLSVGEGDSEAPQSDATAEGIRKQLPPGMSMWHNFAEYEDLLTKHGIGLNVIHNVGAAQVRKIVIGETDHKPTPEELRKMQQLVKEAMEQGAVGLSSALIYPPGGYATTDELVALAKVTAPYGGIYLSHVRDESNKLLEAIDEAISIGEQAGIPVHIYHLKAAGAENWHLIDAAIKKIQDARDRGIDVTADAYPYIYNGIDLGSFIPPDTYANGHDALYKSLADPSVREKLKTRIQKSSDWENWYLHVGADWNNVLIAKVPEKLDPKYEGLSVHQVAVMRKTDDWTTFFDLVQNGNPSVSPRSMNEEQKYKIYRQPWSSISSDGAPTNPQKDAHVHPRNFGTFARIYAKYVRTDHILTLEDAVRKMTSLPSNLLGLSDRGLIAVGMAADVVVFDPARIQDTATFAKPAVYATGVDAVFVNGVLAIDHGQATGATAGQVLLHKSYRSGPKLSN